MSNTPTSVTFNFDESQLTNPIKVDLISTLAKENGWTSDANNPLYNYQGFWYYGLFLQRVINSAQGYEIPGFNASPSKIIISCNPKSGTTWLKALSFVISTRNRFPIERFQDHPLHSTSPHDLVPFIEIHKAKAEGNPVFATHLPYTSLPSSILASGCKIVYIWRDPKDAFISCWQFSHNLRPNKDVSDPIPLTEAFDLFCRGVSSFGPYWDHVLSYWKAFLDRPDKMLFLKYEDMMNDVEFYVKRLAEFMGYPFSNVEEKEGVVARVVEICSFDSLRNAKVKLGDDVNSKLPFSISYDAFFRKGKIGDWKNYLTEEMARKIDQITNDKLGTCGLKL